MLRLIESALLSAAVGAVEDVVDQSPDLGL
jgi:hypothetical protein